VIEALRQNGSTVDFTGIDQSREAIAEARERLGPSVDLRVGDAAELGDNEIYDLVIMIEVLEHIMRPDRILAVLKSLTRRHVLVSVPDEPWFRLMNLLRLKNVARFGNDPEHVNHWGHRQFERFISEQFSVLETKRAFPWTLVLAERSGDGVPARP
jgi:2-polyprenyl-3-methyl-5-hydroxy-6-metoxy-1,4-benzoquinol methylase